MKAVRCAAPQRNGRSREAIPSVSLDAHNVREDVVHKLVDEPGDVSEGCRMRVGTNRLKRWDASPRR